FLLAQLRKPYKPTRPDLTLLAVGGSDYGAVPARTQPLSFLDPKSLPPQDRGNARQWPPLAGARAEARQFQRAAGRPVTVIDGADASTGRLAAELMKARLAHIATHGFFDEDLLKEERKREEEQLKAYTFSMDRTTALVGQRARNPLAFCGLVLAGANLPPE